jgi:hypothetical protein
MGLLHVFAPKKPQGRGGIASGLLNAQVTHVTKALGERLTAAYDLSCCL